MVFSLSCAEKRQFFYAIAGGFQAGEEDASDDLFAILLIHLQNILRISQQVMGHGI
jgi:hypothetical protein